MEADFDGLFQLLGDDHEIHIPVTDEVMTQLKSMRADPRFLEIHAALQETPDRLPEMLLFIRTEYPTLHDVFTEQPRFLMAVLAGETTELEDEGEADGAEEEAEDPATGEHSPDGEHPDLSLADMANIQSVRSPADGNGLRTEGVRGGVPRVSKGRVAGHQLSLGRGGTGKGRPEGVTGLAHLSCYL